MILRRRRSRKKADSWQTIYMDLMTIIMVFFIILWSINQGKDDGISETIGDQTARLINLPGDVLFSAGQVSMSDKGKEVLGQLFNNKNGGVGLTFQDNGLSKRMLVIHGHTDDDGVKANNLELGYQRALSAYQEILKYTPALIDHVVVCSHADNSPDQEVPKFRGKLTKSQRQMLREAKKKNRRISIEDKYINRFEVE